MESDHHQYKEPLCHPVTKAINLKIKEWLLLKVDLLQSTPRSSLRCLSCRIPTLQMQELKEALHLRDSQCLLQFRSPWASSHMRLRDQAYHHLNNSRRPHQWEAEDPGPWLQILHLHKEGLKHLLQVVQLADSQALMQVHQSMLRNWPATTSPSSSSTCSSNRTRSRRLRPKQSSTSWWKDSTLAN